MNVHKVGEEARHQKHIKHIEAVKIKSTELLEISFPNPAIPPSESIFLSGWDKFSQSLMDTFGQQKDYRLAFNHAVNLIKKYQQEHNWEYSPPSHLITNKPSAQLRTARWLKGAWALHDSYQQWEDAYIRDECRDVNFRYQSLLLSLLMDSGHCHIDIIKSFNLLLQSTKTLLLQGFSGHTFVSLELSSDHLNSNDHQDGNPITTYQCYLSLKTQGQLKLWQKLDKSDWQYPSNAKELFAVMVNNFPSHKNIPIAIQAFCSCAAFWYERHCNPNISEALLEYRVGRTHSYSLPTSNLKRLITAAVHPVQSTSFYYFSTNVTVSHKYKNTFKLSGLSLKENQYISKLKKACSPNENGKKVSSETVNIRLQTLLSLYNLEPWQQVFIQWLIHKTHGCSAKTVNQYMLNQIKYWCLMNTKYSLLQLSTVDLEEIYQEQINHHSTTKSQKYYAGRLKELHAFALPFLELPALSDNFFYIDGGKSHTRAGIVDEYLFKALLKHIEQLSDLNNIDRLAIQTICIIGYRCALRMAELYKLKINNLEDSATGWIEIRPNNFGDNKTASGLRKLPLFPLLLEDEHKIVSEYLGYKKSLNLTKASPLLTMGEDIHCPFNMFTLSNYVGKVLRALSGEKHLVFYHLRHSCISRLQLILEHNDPKSLLPNFSPYSQEQTNIIKRLLFKAGLSYGYWEIAAFAGHESPNTTFEHYFHLSDLLADPAYLEQKTSISLKEAQSQGLCSRRQFQALFKEKKKVTQEDCATLLKKSLGIKDIAKEVKQVVIDGISLASQSGETINLNICYLVLEAISGGKRIDTLAYRFRLKQSTIDKWLTNANYLKSLSINSSDKRNNESPLNQNKDDINNFSRHFSKQRKNALIPGKLKTKDEIKYADRFIKSLRDNYKENAADINEMMIYCLSHTSVNKSGITFNSPLQLATFIETFQFAIPKSHWRAVKLYINTSTIKPEWQNILKGMTTTEEKQGTQSGRSGKGSIRLELISPSEKQYINSGKIEKYSSHLLIYLMYMSFVILRKTGV
ncbi:MAG: integrase [Psychromonas sp.]|jgi:integrase|uniref:hypothetical protein n=1 Tax=Psychromonas sp. TaxID=1884585 RepID=UPI0039E55D0C